MPWHRPDHLTQKEVWKADRGHTDWGGSLADFHLGEEERESEVWVDASHTGGSTAVSRPTNFTVSLELFPAEFSMTGKRPNQLLTSLAEEGKGRLSEGPQF